MLTRALRTNIGGLRDVAKQLLIWSKNTKGEFCTSFNLDKKSDKDELFEKRDFRPSRDRYNDWNYDRRNRSTRRWGGYGFNDDEFESEWNSSRKYRGGGGGSYGFERGRDSFRQGGLKLKEQDVVFNEKLKPHVKDFYKPHPDVLNRSPEEIKEFREKNDINVESYGSKNNNFPPILNFSELQLPNNISNVISRLNYTQPTPIQSQTWPIALSGENMVGISRTGSGKTLGFILPALLHVQNQPPIESGEGPIVLIMVPTRELAQQILKVSLPFAKSLDLRVATLFGGANKRPQMEGIYRGCHICVATPGRLNDFLNDDFVKLNRCTYFVLDEADRLLDMGFHPQIKSVFHHCRPDRQVLMWSATWPREVRSLAKTFLRDYVAVKFGSEELAANPNIEQNIHMCENREKLPLLKDLLKKIWEKDDNKTLIFAATKVRADKLQYLLRREGYQLAVIHGDKSQRERNQALEDFRRGRVKILVGTEVVGRGIDIDDIRYVINYDFPVCIKNYVHLIGRTGRKENTGTAHSFFTYEDRPKAAELIKILRQANQPVDPDLERMIPSRSESRRSRNWDY